MDRLINRLDRIMTRLKTVDDQLQQLGQDARLRDDKGSRERRNLLTYLSSFHHEVDHVDGALKRLAMGKYGVCLAGGGAVEADWLESFPDAEFCATCYRTPERMAAG
jgi:RNA polymerase-binding transcription factor DksA